LAQNQQSPSAEGSTNRLNEQLAYSFDPAGNLNYRTNNALVQNFVVNSNNELTSASTSGTLTVMGTTTSAATNVTVNGNPASRYGDSTFAAAGLSLTSSYTAVASDTNGRWATNTVNVDLATSVPFQYDLNGNLTNDGLRSFAYDDENQLIQVWVPGQWSSVFTYDGKMRRRIRQEFTWQGGAWVQTNAVYYVYDGNLVIQERDLNNLPTTTYTRGNDLSGSLQGAGGIGGLLARTSQQYADGPLAGNAFYHADANGNVTMLVNSSQAVVAKYLYDAFGNVLSASGLLANANRYQFSSKEKDLNSGLVYYLYRFYDPNFQRWINRDPLGELGFILLRTLNSYGLQASTKVVALTQSPDPYVYLFNAPLDHIDPHGLSACTDACQKNYANEINAIENNLMNTLAWGWGFCAARGGGAACLSWVSIGAGDRAALQEVAAAASLAGCLSGCSGPPKQCPISNNPGNPIVPVF
jgi:RHS repeat-associated protein